ncbi:hypothetical protein niasHT_036167 [Heterodera trifolii]|uniref:Uncharacterized protein n=1 Tax=Heterodera trifolii TaxID=157864 RepID=A0ABD2IFZ9_9BILA
MPRANDFAFAVLACDSLLITAQTSTFSWWIGYLMPDDATILYYSKNLGIHPREHFLPEWVPIKLMNGKMTLE